MSDYQQLPSNLPCRGRRRGRPPPRDGDAAARAAWHRWEGGRPRSARAGAGRPLPLPAERAPRFDLPDGWDSIPGARGCTPETCGFRDHHADLQAAGAQAVYGLSSQSTDYQSELADRLGLPFSILSDPDLAFAEALDLPTFEASG